MCLNDKIHNQSVIFPFTLFSSLTEKHFFSQRRGDRKHQSRLKCYSLTMTTKIVCSLFVCVCSRVQGPPSQPISSLVSNAGPKAGFFFFFFLTELLPDTGSMHRSVQKIFKSRSGKISSGSLVFDADDFSCGLLPHISGRKKTKKNAFSADLKPD